MEPNPTARPMNRRLFLKGAALSLVGLTVFGIDAPMRAMATEETLNALSNAQAEYETAMAELQNITAQLEEAQYNLSQCQANLDATNAQIAETEASIAQKQQELADAQDTLADRIRANYTSGGVDLLDMVFSATTFEDFVSRLYYAGKVSDSDAQAIQEVKDLKAELETEEAALQDQRAEQEQLLADQQALTDQLASTQDYYQSYTASLSAEVTALMEQARAEEEAARQAAYEAYLAQQAADEAAGGGGSPDGGSSDGGYSDGGTSDGGYSDAGGGSSGGAPSGGGGGYTGGNHVSSVVGIAWNYVGVTPYVWGGTSPSGFDCSGLTQYCYAQAGYSIGRDTYAQAANISARGQMTYNMGDLQPGDLVFPHAGHVGIYCGGGMMIHAPYEGRTVSYDSVYAFSFGGCPV